MKPDTLSIIISIYLCLIIVSIFLFSSDQFFHWFVIPVLFCGVLIGIDMVDWLRNRLDIFDPIGMVGLLGFHFFFLAPLLHVYWDYGMSFVVEPPDWRIWVGGMSIINSIGIMIYRMTRRVAFNHFNKDKKQDFWKIDKRKFAILSGYGLLITGAMQIWVYVQHGGLLGYIISYTERDGSFEGQGWIFMISESFPILLIMVIAVFIRKSKHKKTWLLILTILIIFFIARMFFGGLRGSRSNTIWALIWAAGIIHLWVRPFKKKQVFIGLVFIVLFVYVYGFYKSSGMEVTNFIEGADARSELTQDPSRSMEAVLLEDFARTNVQSFILYRLITPTRDYEYAWGRTYLGAMSLMIPRSIWPNRPTSKRKEGTEIQQGMSTFNPDSYLSSRVYGLAGEAMLNFGYFAAPFFFLFLGVLVGKVRYWIVKLEQYDSRTLILPFFIIICFLLLVLDLDNFVFVLVKNGAVPMLIIYLSSNKLQRW